MKGLIQRVSEANVSVDGDVVGRIGEGILLLLGVEHNDTETHAEKLIERIINYRIFSDEQGKMNKSLHDIGGKLLIVSQFTLVADTAKGRRPGFSKGASPQQGNALYEYAINHAKAQGITVATGQFGADMHVSLTNNGPVTFLLEN